MRKLWPAAVLLALVAARPAAAEEVSLSAEGGYLSMTSAKKSADAIFGSSGGPDFGVSIRFHLSKKLFAGIGARLFSKDGERVFVATPGGTVFHLGHPVKMTVLPVYALGGLRFRNQASLRPYVGLGAGAAWYREKTTVGGLDTTDSKTGFSGRGFAGAEFGKGSFRFGLEAAYSIVPDAIGTEGVSAVYRETDVGGASVVGRLIFALR